MSISIESKRASEAWARREATGDVENGESEYSLGRISISDKDELLPYPSTRPGIAHSLYHILFKPQTFFIATGVGVLTLIALTTSTLVTIRSWPFEATMEHVHVHHDHHDHKTIALGNTSFSPPGLRRSPDGLLTECGITHIEAIENGCIFDEMAFQYTPPACFEADLLAATIDPTSFLAPDAAGIFPWYRWHNFTEPVAQDPAELSRYNYLWTTNDWHISHCLYMWRLTNNAVNRVATGEKGVYVLEDAIAGGHVSHCNMLVSDKVNPGQTPLRAFRTIGKCVRLDEKEGEKSDLDF